ALDGAKLLRWRGEVLPLVTLRALLGREEASGEEASFEFVVVRAKNAADETSERGLAAVVMDGLEGRGQVLVRGLGRHAGRWYGVSGATEMRDGTAALVLDLPRLLEARA
ncbi:MAG TPA: chemotaxis protein CheW, partial [Pyrinomonadaceae bacterium]|nr:chemotaxis protein CheW [Pyrinomonadaceae bacterium]